MRGFDSGPGTNPTSNTFFLSANDHTSGQSTILSLVHDFYTIVLQLRYHTRTHPHDLVFLDLPNVIWLNSHLSFCASMFRYLDTSFPTNVPQIRAQKGDCHVLSVSPVAMRGGGVEVLVLVRKT